MATYNFEEREKIDGFRAWWDKYGTAITVVLTVILVTIGGMQLWKYYQQQQAQQAADLYSLLRQVQSTNDPAKINDAAQLLTEGFPSSGYAPRAALIAAQSDVQAGNNKRAIQNLQWIIDHAGRGAGKDAGRDADSGALRRLVVLEDSDHFGMFGPDRDRLLSEVEAFIVG